MSWSGRRVARSLPRTCQASDSVPSGSAEQRRGSRAQVVGLCVAIDAQRYGRVMAVPGRHDVYRDARGEHEAHAGVPLTEHLTGSPSSEVDDFATQTSQHQVLQRHRRRSQTGCHGPAEGQRRAGRVLLGGRNPHPHLADRRRQRSHQPDNRPHGRANSRAAMPTPNDARIWLDDGQAPNGATGRAFTDKSVHGFDLTFAAPKSVSLLRALTDDIAEKVLAAAHTKAVHAAMAYLHAARRLHPGPQPDHRQPRPATAARPGGDRLPARNVAVRRPAPAHPRHRAQPPTPSRRPTGQPRLQEPVPRGQGRRHHLPGHPAPRTARRARLRMDTRWTAHTGMAEIAGVTKDTIKAWSQRSTRLREWARNNLTVVDGEPTAAQLAAAQKATRPAKPESLAWEELKEQWRADARGLRAGPRRALRRARTSAAPHTAARSTARASPRWPRTSTRPRSPAPTWSNSSARNCRSTRPATRAR